MCIKSEFKEICLKLARNGRSDKGFLLTSKVCPQWVVCPCLGLYTCEKTHKKNGKNSDFRFFLNWQQMGKVIRNFC